MYKNQAGLSAILHFSRQEFSLRDDNSTGVLRLRAGAKMTRVPLQRAGRAEGPIAYAAAS